MKLTLYSRPACHLCDEMLEALQPLQSEFGFTIEKVDVDAGTIDGGATLLAELAPDNLNQVFFGSSGSEANDTAIRLCADQAPCTLRQEQRRPRYRNRHETAAARSIDARLTCRHQRIIRSNPWLSYTVMVSSSK